MSHQKAAIVTGAGSGIGRAVAVGLSAEGYRVALLGRRRERLAETAGRCAAETLLLVADVGEAAQVRAAFAEIEQAWGRLDLLFNNAGAGAPGLIDALTDEQWHRVVRTNLDGTFYCAREAFSLMRRQQPQGGRIINNGSISAQVPRPASIAYATTKHAMTGLTKSLSLDGRPFGIACGQIDIGNADTEMAAPLKSGARQADGSMRPEPMIEVQDVANAILFMARLPLEANVPFITIMATAMPLVGRG